PGTGSPPTRNCRGGHIARSDRVAALPHPADRHDIAGPRFGVTHTDRNGGWPMTYSRREFVRASALGAVAALFPQSLLGMGRARAEFTLIRRNVGIFTERGGVVGWLVNNDGVLVVDSQFADTAPLLVSGLRERTSRTIDFLVNSHHHP